MPKSAMALSLSEPDKEQLGAWVRALSTAQQVALRCRIILAAAQGLQDLEIAAELGINRHTAALWRKRVMGEGIGCVWEIAPGRGRKPKYDQAKRQAIIEATLQTKPKAMTLTGQSAGRQQKHRQPTLAVTQPQAPSESHV